MPPILFHDSNFYLLLRRIPTYHIYTQFHIQIHYLKEVLLVIVIVRPAHQIKPLQLFEVNHRYKICF